MDPDACLAEIRSLTAKILADGGNHRVDSFRAQRLAELVDALDAWIVGGGFMPKRWTER